MGDTKNIVVFLIIAVLLVGVYVFFNRNSSVTGEVIGNYGELGQFGNILVNQGGYIQVGRAVLSSGGDYAHLATGEYFDGSRWRGSGQLGSLIQLERQNINFYTHNGYGSHEMLASIGYSGLRLGYSGARDTPRLWFNDVCFKPRRLVKCYSDSGNEDDHMTGIDNEAECQGAGYRIESVTPILAQC